VKSSGALEPYLIAVQRSPPAPDRHTLTQTPWREVYIEAQVDAQIAASLGRADAFAGPIEAGPRRCHASRPAIAPPSKTHQGALGRCSQPPDSAQFSCCLADLPPESLALKVFWGWNRRPRLARNSVPHAAEAGLRDPGRPRRDCSGDQPACVSAAMVPTPSAPDTADLAAV